MPDSRCRQRLSPIARRLRRDTEHCGHRCLSRPALDRRDRPTTQILLRLKGKPSSIRTTTAMHHIYHGMFDLRGSITDAALPDSWTISRLSGIVFTDHIADPLILARDLIHEAGHVWLKDLAQGEGPIHEYLQADLHLQSRRRRSGPGVGPGHLRRRGAVTFPRPRPRLSGGCRAAGGRVRRRDRGAPTDLNATVSSVRLGAGVVPARLSADWAYRPRRAVREVCAHVDERGQLLRVGLGLRPGNVDGDPVAHRNEELAGCG